MSRREWLLLLLTGFLPLALLAGLVIAMGILLAIGWRLG